MLTRIQIKNFKKLEDVDIELGGSVVLIGPNNSGKTTALQALALWDIGLRRWSAEHGEKLAHVKRPGVTINRRDLISIPVPSAGLLWRDMHVRNVKRTEGKQETKNIRIDIVVHGISNGKEWSCGLEFDYANDESFYCRPLRLTEGKEPARMDIPHKAMNMRIAFLPPMSGLASVEPKSEPGRIDVLLGEGQTAHVLRNLCYQIYDKPEPKAQWHELKDFIQKFFGVELLAPVHNAVRGEITMGYREASRVELDLSSSGRGMQQTLLLLTHLYANPGAVLLLDEPDAHLEVLRQRQIYQLLTDAAKRSGSQIIVASHSEVVLNEAADRDIVIAFVGRPHRIDDRSEKGQLLKALKEIGFEHYYLAEMTGWVLYLEGSTDLAILHAFAKTLEHPAMDALERPFVHYVLDQPGDVRKHFWGIKYANPNLIGLAIFDRLEKSVPADIGVETLQWKRKELENYLCMEEVLLSYANYGLSDDLFGLAEAGSRESAMKESIAEISAALKTLKRLDPWSSDTKVTDDFLDPLFEKYFERLGLPNILRKTNYHVLAGLVPKDRIDQEVIEKLDKIVEVSKKAKEKTPQ